MRVYASSAHPVVGTCTSKPKGPPCTALPSLARECHVVAWSLAGPESEPAAVFEEVHAPPLCLQQPVAELEHRAADTALALHLGDRELPDASWEGDVSMTDLDRLPHVGTLIEDTM